MAVKTDSAIPAGWRRARLKDLAEINPDQLGDGSDPDLPISYIDLSAVASPSSTPTPTHYRFKDAPSRARRVVQDGDILVSTVRPYLRTFTRVPSVNGSEPTRVASTGFAVVRPRHAADGDFLYQHVLGQRFTAWLLPLMTGSNYPAVNADDVSDYPLLCPPDGERQFIGAALCAVDDAIDATRGVIEQTRRLKTAVLQDLLTRGLPGRHSEFREVKNLGQIPRAWKLMPLSKAVSYWQYGLSESLSDAGAYPCFRMNNYLTGRLVANDLKYIDLSHKALRTYRLERGDILFNRTNSRDLVGKIGIFDLDGDYVFASYLVRLRANPEIARPEFLNLLLNTAGNQERIRRLATPGVSQSNINVESLKQFRVALPETDEQDAIVDAVVGLDRRRDRELEARRQLVSLKAALSQALLIGRVRVPVSEASNV